MAVEEDKKDIVDFLVKEGADTNIKDDAGVGIVMRLFLANQWPDGRIREEYGHFPWVCVDSS